MGVADGHVYMSMIQNHQYPNSMRHQCGDLPSAGSTETQILLLHSNRCWSVLRSSRDREQTTGCFPNTEPLAKWITHPANFRPQSPTMWWHSGNVRFRVIADSGHRHHYH